MEATPKRRLALASGGVLLAATVTTLTQLALVAESVVPAEPYAVAIGVAIAAPMLLAAAYPRTEADVAADHPRWLLVVAEIAVATLAGVGTVALLVTVDLPSLLPVGGAAAAAYLGAIVARAVVMGLFRTSGE